MDVEEKTLSPLIRFDDCGYLFHASDNPVMIHVHGVNGDGRLTRLVAETAQKILKQDEPDLSQHFLVRNRYWKIFPREQSGGYLWSLVNLVQTLYKNAHSEIYDIHETGYLGWWWDSDIMESTEISIPLEESFTIKVNDFLFLHEPYDREPFTDPFTRLATIAYQEYESSFSHRDYFSFKECRTRIIFYKNQFSLVRAESPLAHNIETNQLTLNHYLSFITEKFGKKKIEEIIHRYRLTFDDEVGLTPEHIYRMNIGVHDICVDDVKGLWGSFHLILETYGTVSPETPLEDYLESIPCDLLPGRIKRALCCFLKKPWSSPRKGDFVNWWNRASELGSFEKIEEVTPRTFNQLMHFFIPDDKACYRSQTGRNPYGFVRSYYDGADVQEFKPWVDQRDCFRSILPLRGQSSPDLFYEKLTHIFAKKHLARQMPDGNYRVGGLIPSYHFVDGEQLWYEVTGCISTPTGFHSYTLECVLPRFLVDKIKNYRSTYSDPCGLRYQATLFNVGNSLNSPGYEGREIAERYEFPFFQESTIPVWVGYTLIAEKGLGFQDVDTIFNWLCAAKKSFKKYLSLVFKRKDLRTIIREHDAILNYLYRRKRRSLRSYNDIASYVRKADLASEEQEGQIAQKLLDQLGALSAEEEDKVRKEDIVHLKDELYRHILHYYEPSFVKEKSKSRRLYVDIFNFPRLYKKANDIEDKGFILREWIRRLTDLAIEFGENLEVKRAQNIVLAGHSLGGACACSHIDLYFRQRERIPCPEKNCVGYVLYEPGINDRDNERFKEWGNSHRVLMRMLQCGFHLERGIESGDLVSTGGEVHLGATYSPDEDKQLKSWLTYRFRILKRLPEAKNLTIASSSSAHETQFEEGEKGVDYEEMLISSDELGLFDQRGRFMTVFNRMKRQFIRKTIEAEKQKEIWEKLRKKWGLGEAFKYLDGERVRGDSLLTRLYLTFVGFDGEERIKGLTDVHGNFVVTRKGVISKSEDRDEGKADGVGLCVDLP